MTGLKRHKYSYPSYFLREFNCSSTSKDDNCARPEDEYAQNGSDLCDLAQLF